MRDAEVAVAAFVDWRREIEEVFEGKAFQRPLFYLYPGGLRFELSEGGTWVQQFLVALRKANKICEDIFPAEQPMVVCLRMVANPGPFAHRETLKQLHGAGISIPHPRHVWVAPVSADDGFDEEDEVCWLHVVFEAPASLLQNFLWCALAKDWGSIRPRPGCDIYLFNFGCGVMVFPYDDRGMDVVGPGHTFLAQIYRTHNQYLLDYDREVMAAVFEQA